MWLRIDLHFIFLYFVTQGARFLAGIDAYSNPNISLNSFWSTAGHKSLS
uniref:Uncharacterized protein n=1 Tax=virus sp. ctnRj46 TaxID=2826814 RepID=A0A8S5R6W8_9VIRU|nr:MAG TPA: hypothetical protein [virus sp. ctnRj46]